MAGKIPRNFIDDLISRIDIVDIINSRVPLKRAGKEYGACCPFHNEKTPSFSVSREKQFYHCFGCGAHGTAIGFLMDHDRMGFVEAIETLAHDAGMEVPREAGEQTGPDSRPVFDILNATSEFYRQQLRTHPQASNAVDYLKKRGLSGEIAARYDIGYAPPGWDNLLQQHRQSSEELALLRRAGLIIETDGKRYDRFRDRVIFPIRDMRGRTLGFGGRVLTPDKPKYLNSPETEVFHKGRELYGLYEARKYNREINKLIIVEGYMDVVALAQFGIDYAVATLGTATSPDHLKRLFGASAQIVFCFDGDRAGQDAAWKALQTTLPHLHDGREVRFLPLPEGNDPDSLVRQEGAERFAQRIDRAIPLSDYLFDHLGAELDLRSLDGRAHFSQLARPLLETLPQGVFRSMMFHRLSDLLELDARQLDPNSRKRTRHPTRKSNLQRMTPIRRAIGLLLQHPKLATSCRDQAQIWRTMDMPGIKLLNQLLELLQGHPNLTTAALLEHWRDTDEGNPLQKLAVYQFAIENEGLEEEFCGALQRLNQQAKELEAERLYSKTSPTGMTKQEKERLRRLTTRPTSHKSDDR